MRQRIQAVFSSPSFGYSLALVAATTLAFGLDYLFNVSMGRMLTPEGFGILIALAGVGQVMVVLSRVIQTVVMRYVSSFSAAQNGKELLLPFFNRTFWRMAQWGGLATLLLLLLSPSLARFLRIPSAAPAAALALTAVLMAVRPVIGGVLQGEQRFVVLGAIQLTQAAVRLAAGILLVWWGLGALGGMLALPIGSLAALLLGLGLLRLPIGGWRRSPPPDVSVPAADIGEFASYTAAGLVAYALLVNMDAILVKRFFDPTLAGYYSAAVTLGKIVQFFPLAIIMILLPKAARRQAARQDSSDVLLLAMLVVGGICGGVALLFFLFPQPIVRIVFGDAYLLPDQLLGLMGVAMALLSLANVWLNYFLSTRNRPVYIYCVLLALLIQFGLMGIYHAELWHFPAIMIANGFWLTGVGGYLFWRQQRRSSSGGPAATRLRTD